MIQKSRSPIVIITSLATVGLLFLLLYFVKAANNNTYTRSHAASVSCDYTITVAEPSAPTPTNAPVAAAVPTDTPVPTAIPVEPTAVPVADVPVIQCTTRADISIVLDRSGSMDTKESDGRTKLAWAKEAAALFVAAIKASGTTLIRLSIASYGSQGNDGTGTLSTSTNSTLDVPSTTDYDAVLLGLNNLPTQRSSSCGQCGLRIGTTQVAAGTNTKAVILLSDGKMNHVWNGGTSNANNVAIAEADNGRTMGVSYYVLGYGSGSAINEPTLKSIAGPAANYTHRPNATDWVAGFVELLPKFCTPQ